MPTAESSLLIDGLVRTAGKLLENRLMRSHDLTGAVFQRLIVDRKFLAAFYTTPASAALLVGLAITPDQLPSGGQWSSAKDVTALHVADFACGTGTLLSTAYQRISQHRWRPFPSVQLSESDSVDCQSTIAETQQYVLRIVSKPAAEDIDAAYVIGIRFHSDPYRNIIMLRNL